MEATNIEFVKEVENYPELYDYTKPDYSRKDVAERAWAAVGKKFNLSGKESKEKWRNLRNSFVKNLKPPASGSSAKRKRSYYLSDAMQFTLPFVKSQGVISGNRPEVPNLDVQVISSPSSENQNDVQDPALLDDLEPPTETTTPQPPSESHHAPEPHRPTTSSGSSSSTSESFLEKPRSMKKKRVASASEDADKIAAYFEAKKQYVEAKRNAAENLPRDSEAMKMFLLSLIPDLATLTPTQIRTFKRRTLDLVEELVDAGTAEKMPSSSHPAGNSEPLFNQPPSPLLLRVEPPSQFLGEESHATINDKSESQGQIYFKL